MRRSKRKLLADGLGGRLVRGALAEGLIIVTAPRSSLAGIAAAARESDPANARAEAKRAWHRDGLILINTAWLPGWADRRQAELLAEKCHGKRKGDQR